MATLEDSKSDVDPRCCFGSCVYASSVPNSCKANKNVPGEMDIQKSPEIYMGIDEAGRGAVIGPMVYGVAYWPASDDERISADGYNDSKALTESKREALFKRLKATEGLGWAVRVIGAKELSAKMLRMRYLCNNACSAARTVLYDNMPAILLLNA
eukprot:471236_1